MSNSIFLGSSLDSFCESWLNEGISDAEVRIPQCSVIRCVGKRGGGVCVYVKNGSLPLSRYLAPLKHCDSISDTSISLLPIYIPPGLTSSNYKEIADYIVDTYDKTTVSNTVDYLTIAGDMNQFPTRLIEAQFNVTKIVDSPTRGDVVLD